MNESINGSLGTIAKSANKGDITSSGNYAGGIAGENKKIIENTYNTGNVTGTDIVGGIVGHNLNSSATVSKSFSSSTKISGSSETGGIVGWNDDGTVNASYFLKDVNADVPANGIGKRPSNTGANPITILKKSIQSTFSGWDFTNIWKMTTTGPALKWEK